jgi:hypothetical protein
LEEVWQNSSEDTNVKLKQAFSNLHQWGQETFGNIPRRIKQLQQTIHNMKTRIPTREEISYTHQLEAQLDNLLKNEEIWWAQRAKANWLKQGDKNSKFFHLKASQRKRKNTINFINNHHGNKVTDNKEIQNVFMDYFTNIFTSSNPANISDTLAGISNRVHPTMYNYLNQDFSAAEVQQSVFQLNSNSAPGPDGLSANFFQSYVMLCSRLSQKP